MDTMLNVTKKDDRNEYLNKADNERKICVEAENKNDDQYENETEARVGTEKEN